LKESCAENGHNITISEILLLNYCVRRVKKISQRTASTVYEIKKCHRNMTGS